MVDEQLKSELEEMLSSMEDEEQFSICEIEGGRNKEPAAASSGDKTSNIGFHQQPCLLNWQLPVLHRVHLLCRSFVQNQLLKFSAFANSFNNQIMQAVSHATISHF